MLLGKALFSRAFSLAIIPGVLSLVTSCHQVGMLSQVKQDEQAQGEATMRLSPNNQVTANYALDDNLVQDAASLYNRLFGKDYETNVDKLVAYATASVERERIPYSDSAYPELQSSQNVRASRRPMLDALAKYDAAFHDGQDLAVSWEKENHADASVPWYGHCNGFSSASSRHQDPRKTVYRPKGCTAGSAGCVAFAPRDIRALLAEIYMNASSRFLAGDRCDRPAAALSNAPQNRSDPLRMDECDDVSPAGFHLALINWVGVQKQVLIMDLARDAAVWNFPVYAYSMRYGNGGRRLSRAEAAGVVGRRGQRNDYAFNPKASSFVTVETVLTFAQELDEQPSEAAPTQPQQKIYSYLLELDDKGKVLGGEWLGRSRSDHPDFVWMPFAPFDPPGNRRYGNKQVSPKEVISLWAESMGFDPDNPFADKNNPNKIIATAPQQEGWGRFKDYQVVLDGNAAGVVFLGKKTSLRLLREEVLQGDVKVAISMDERPLVELSGQAAQDMSVSFEAGPGFHTMAFTWSKAGAELPEAAGRVRFFASP